MHSLPRNADRIEDLTTQVLRSLPHQSIIAVDPALVVVLAEGAPLAAHGYDRHAIVGRSLMDVLPASAYAELEPHYRAALAGQSRALEYPSRDGTAWYWVQIEPLRDGEAAVAGAIAVSTDVTARKRAEEQHRHTSRLLQDVLDSIATPVSVKDADGRFTLINRAYETALGRSRDEIAGKTVHDLYPPEFAARYAADDERVMRDGVVVEEERDAPHADGTVHTYRMSRAPLRDPDGRVYGLCAVGTDVSERRSMELELRRATQRFETAFADAPIGMALVGLDGRWMRANRSLLDLLGYGEEELASLTFQDITHPDDLDADLAYVDQLLAGEIDHYTLEKRYYTKRGHLIWILLSGSLVRDDSGDPLHFIAQVQDISERKRMEGRLRELAERDPVTDLFNRRRFEDELRLQVERSRRYGEQAALLLMDVDRFKAVNDRHGHRLGDAALRVVGRAIRERLRASDIVARVGGDELAAILCNVPIDRAAAIAEDIRTAVAGTSVSLGGESVSITLSIGLHPLDETTASAQEAFGAADRALYAAKSAGRDRVSIG